MQIIRIGGHCNQNCLFCCQASSYNNTSYEDYVEQISRAKKTIVLSGSETTMYSRILDLIGIASEKKLLIELQSNGLTLAYPSLVKKFVQAGVTSFNINFPAFLEKTNDVLTQTKHTLNLRLKALENLSGTAVPVMITFVVNSMNYREMPELAGFIRKKYPAMSIMFVYPQMAGNVIKNEFLLIKYETIESYLKQAVALKKDFYAENFPLCLLGRYYAQSVNCQKSDDDFFPYNHPKPTECRKCKVNSICQGIPDYYTKRYEFHVRPFD